MIFGLGLLKFGSGQPWVKFFFSFFSQFCPNLTKKGIQGWWSSACKNHWQKWWSSACHNVVKFWSLGLDKIIPPVARVLKIIVQVSAKKVLGRVLIRLIPNTKVCPHLHLSVHTMSTLPQTHKYLCTAEHTYTFLRIPSCTYGQIKIGRR